MIRVDCMYTYYIHKDTPTWVIWTGKIWSCIKACILFLILVSLKSLHLCCSGACDRNIHIWGNLSAVGYHFTNGFKNSWT